MTKPNNSKTKWIWLSVLILVVCVAATTIVFLSRLDSFLLNDEGAISLITDDISKTNDVSNETDDTLSSDSAVTLDFETVQDSEAGQDSASSIDATGTSKSESSTSATAPRIALPPKEPGFEAGDDKTVWDTNTQVEIFKVSYVNGEQVITVNSDNGDKVIAPGTENSYTFKLKNTGNVTLDYTVEVDAYFTPGDIEIPIISRLNRYDGKWVVGGKDEYVKVSVLDTAEDKAKLRAGRYTYYTLDWIWPFESGNDELDTMFGNLAVEQELRFAIAIKTTATESSHSSAGGGITPPQTGDNSDIILWVVLSIFSSMIFLHIFIKPRRSGVTVWR